MPLTLKEIQTTVDDFIQKTPQKYFHQLGNMCQLTEEVGELARIISRKYGEQKAKSTDKIDKNNLADEITDVLFTLICIANQCEIDLDKSFKINLQKKEDRFKKVF